MQKFPVRTIVTTGALGALSVVMAMVPQIGYISWIPGLPALTIMHIPVILAAILEGPVAGTVVGLVFGVSSLIKAATMPTGPFDVLFVNPMVSVLPRLLIGIAAWAVYRLFRGKLTPLAAGVAGAVGGLTNTVFVLLMLGLSAAEEITAILSLASTKAVPAFLIGVASGNGLIEAGAAAIITSAIVSAWLGIASATGKAKLAREEKR